MLLDVYRVRSRIHYMRNEARSLVGAVPWQTCQTPPAPVQVGQKPHHAICKAWQSGLVRMGERAMLCFTNFTVTGLLCEP